MNNSGDPVMGVLEYYFSEATLLILKLILKSSAMVTIENLGLENVYDFSNTFPYGPLNMTDEHKTAYNESYPTALGTMIEFWEYLLIKSH